MILLTIDEIICANVGDSRAVLTQNISTFDLSDDHKPFNDDAALQFLRRIDAGNVDAATMKGFLAAFANDKMNVIFPRHWTESKKLLKYLVGKLRVASK